MTTATQKRERLTKVIRKGRKWADSCAPFGLNRVKWPVIGTNWKGYVYVKKDSP